MENSDKHAHWSSAIVFIAFFVMIVMCERSCDSVIVEKEKTKQFEFQHQK